MQWLYRNQVFRGRETYGRGISRHQKQYGSTQGLGRRGALGGGPLSDGYEMEGVMESPRMGEKIMALVSASGEDLRKPPALIDTGSTEEQTPQVGTTSYRDS